MRQMQIVWKRLVKNGETCVRCGSTGRELEAAVAKLAAALKPLDIEPVLKTQEIDEAAFRTDTAESNRVWIAGRPIEEWLNADVGMTRCCSVCGESDCRTLEMDGHTYETIPEEQFIKAALMAASQMLAAPGGKAASCGEESCAPVQEPANTGGCCA